MLIVVAALLIVWEAVPAILSPVLLEAPVLGLAINFVAGVINAGWAYVLIRAGARHRSPALSADGHHILSDVVTSAGVLVGCLRFGYMPLLLVPGAAISEVVTRATFETQVLLAALRLEGELSPPAEPAQRMPFLRQTIASALDGPAVPLAELVNEELIVQGILWSAGRPREVQVPQARPSTQAVPRS